MSDKAGCLRRTGLSWHNKVGDARRLDHPHQRESKRGSALNLLDVRLAKKMLARKKNIRYTWKGLVVIAASLPSTGQCEGAPCQIDGEWGMGNGGNHSPYSKGQDGFVPHPRYEHLSPAFDIMQFYGSDTSQAVPQRPKSGGPHLRLRASRCEVNNPQQGCPHVFPRRCHCAWELNSLSRYYVAIVAREVVQGFIATDIAKQLVCPPSRGHHRRDAYFLSWADF